VFSLLAATEITEGVFYPVGGFGKVGGCRRRRCRCRPALHGAVGGKGGNRCIATQHQCQRGADPHGMQVKDALASIAREHGAVLETGACVARVACEGARAVGVMLQDGRDIQADLVVVNRCCTCAALRLPVPCA
jgi:hypothetical protein